MNKLTSFLGAAAVLAIAVVFILQFRPASNATRTDTGPECAVEVRGSCISRSRFQAANRLISANADRNRLRSIGFGKKVAEGLVEAWLLDQDAKRLGVAVSDEEVTNEIAKGRAHVSLPAADIHQLGRDLQVQDGVRDIPVKNPKTKKFDAKYAEKQIRFYSMMSPTEFRDYQRSELVADRMRDLIRSRVRVGENEAYDQFSRDKSTVTLDYARFERRFFADLLVDLSDKAVAFWADSHKEDIDKMWESRKSQILPECRDLREIFVKIDETASDEDKAKAKARIDQAEARLKKGDAFGDVARAMSDGPTANQGGALGCAIKGKMAKPLEEAAMKLTAGQTTDVVPTEGGFFILKLDQIAKDADAEKLGRAQITKELYVKFESERLAVEASKKVQAAMKGGKSLKEALDQFYAELPKATSTDKKDKKGDKDKKTASADDHPALSIDNHPNRPTAESTLPFNVANEPISGVHAPELGKIAFGLDKPGDAPSDSVGYELGYLAVQLKEKTPASKEAWEKNKELYVGAMRAAKANDALVAYMKRLHSQLANEAKFTSSIVDEKAPKGGEAPIDDDQGE